MIGRIGGAIPLHAGLDADARDEAVGRWVLASWTAPRSGRPLYSVDGKTLRGAGLAAVQVRLLTVLDQHSATVLGQVEEADYRGPVSDQEFTDAEHALGAALPARWRAYLQGPSWFWTRTESYVRLNTPHEMLEQHHAWKQSNKSHPGLAIIGGD